MGKKNNNKNPDFVSSQELLEYLHNNFKTNYHWDNGECYWFISFKFLHESTHYRTFIVFKNKKRANHAAELLEHYNPHVFSWWRYTDLFGRDRKTEMFLSMRPYQEPFEALDKLQYTVSNSYGSFTYNPCNFHVEIINEILNEQWRLEIREEWRRKQNDLKIKKALKEAEEKLKKEKQQEIDTINSILKNHRKRTGKTTIKRFLNWITGK
jgi:hypothetical protein